MIRHHWIFYDVEQDDLQVGPDLIMNHVQSRPYTDSTTKWNIITYLTQCCLVKMEGIAMRPWDKGQRIDWDSYLHWWQVFPLAGS